MAKTNAIYRFIGGEDFQMFIIVECVEEIDLAALLATDLCVHYAAASVEAYLTTVGDQDFSYDPELIVKDLIDPDCVPEGDPNDAANWMDAYSLNSLTLLSLQMGLLRGHGITP